jgi:hypothetical protein
MRTKSLIKRTEKVVEQLSPSTPKIIFRLIDLEGNIVSESVNGQEMVNGPPFRKYLKGQDDSKHDHSDSKDGSPMIINYIPYSFELK